jgi:uncharacterized protein YjbJ (UPF0337 family)
MANESRPQAGAESVADDVKGRAKEAVGAVTGNESVKQEGQAQQDKAAAQRDVAAKEAEAEKARAAVSAAEAEQRSQYAPYRPGRDLWASVRCRCRARACEPA